MFLRGLTCLFFIYLMVPIYFLNIAFIFILNIQFYHYFLTGPTRNFSARMNGEGFEMETYFFLTTSRHILQFGFKFYV